MCVILYYARILALCLVMFNWASNYCREPAKCCYTQNFWIFGFNEISLTALKWKTVFFFFWYKIVVWLFEDKSELFLSIKLGLIYLHL